MSSTDQDAGYGEAPEVGRFIREVVDELNILLRKFHMILGPEGVDKDTKVRFFYEGTAEDGKDELEWLLDFREYTFDRKPNEFKRAWDLLSTETIFCGTAYTLKYPIRVSVDENFALIETNTITKVFSKNTHVKVKDLLKIAFCVVGEHYSDFGNPYADEDGYDKRYIVAGVEFDGKDLIPSLVFKSQEQLKL